jgi:carboxypeptidase C (cathepsin A)
MKFKIFIAVTVFFILLNYSVWGQSPGKAKAGVEAKKPALTKIDEAKLGKLSVTRHSITLKGKVFRYQAAAGYMLMKDKTGKHQASIFFIAYTKEGAGVQKRPITFAFNGGPGSAALWLHMGGLGPKRVKMSDEGLQFPQPFQYVDNEATWLEFTDLVFIDPVSTGYSRPVQGVDKKQFHGVMEDIRSVGDFIRLYITKNKRWLSPKFICGESYGTVRAVGLAAYLQDTYGMYLQGLVLVSAVLDFHTLVFTPGNDLPYSLFLPTYTAAARYHKKLPEKYREDLQTTLKEVEQWALTDYWLALAKGNRLTEEERKEIIDRLSQYTGLPKKTIDNNNLRIEMSRFTLGLLKDEKQIVGRLDSRFKGMHLGDDLARYNSLLDDPSASATSGAFTAVINDYIRNELKYVNDIPYWPLSMEVYPWDFGSVLDYIHIPRVLKKAISWNNELKVMIANGYYDQATPYFATLYTVEHIDLPPHLQKNIVMKYYESGHMMYIRKASRQKLRDDTYEFYMSSLK